MILLIAHKKREKLKISLVFYFYMYNFYYYENSLYIIKEEIYGFSYFKKI